MSLRAQIQQDVKEAMRAKASQKLAALRLITAAIKQIEVDERITVDGDRLIQLLDKLAKQRKESMTQFQAANRQDLVEKEQFELTLIQSYLPSPLAQAELLHLIDTVLVQLKAISIADMGKVMSHLKPMIQGRCDMTQVSAMVKARLHSA